MVFLMSGVRDIAYDVLLQRHRLTSRQVNLLLGERVLAEDVNGKLADLETLDEFIRVADAFNAAGMVFIPLKGPVLSYRLYGDATTRYYRDLDILVEWHQAGMADEILSGLGYAACSPPWPAEKKHQQRLMKHTNQLSYEHISTHRIIELHWRLLDVTPVSNRRLEEIIRCNTMPFSFAGRSFTVLSDEMELLYLVIHGGLHFFRRLKWLVDADLFLRTREIDRDRFTALACELKASRLIALFRAIQSIYFPGHTTIPCSSLPIRYMVTLSERKIGSTGDDEHDTIRGIMQSLFYRLIAFPGIRYKVRTVLNFMFVPEYYDHRRFSGFPPLFYAYCMLLLAVNRAKR